MSFRGYDVLTQLIPGSFILYHIIWFYKLMSFLGLDINTPIEYGSLFLITSYVLGYGINTLSQIIESHISLNHYLITKIFNYLSEGTNSPKGIIWIFSKSSKINHCDYLSEKERNVLKVKSPEKRYSKLISKVDKSKTNLSWLNEDIKFARVFTLTLIISITLLILNLNFKSIITPLIIETSLILLTLHRYIQVKIDYIITVIKYKD